MRDFERWPTLKDIVSRRDFIRYSLLGAAAGLAACATPVAPSPATAPAVAPAVAPSQPQKDIPEIRPITTQELKQTGWKYATIDLPYEPPQQLSLLTAPIPVGATFYYLPFNSEVLATQALGNGVPSIGVWVRMAGEIAYRGLFLSTATYLATTPRVIQDMSEGPIQYKWDGKMITVDSVDGKVDARPLQRVDVKEKVDKKDKVKPTKEPRKIAIVEDDLDIRDLTVEIIGDFISIGNIKTFLSCEDLLVAMKSGQKFDLVLLDYDLGKGNMTGPMCIPNIRSVQPNVIIIGRSAYAGDNNSTQKAFIRAGANTFIEKMESVKVVQKTVRLLLNIPK